MSADGGGGVARLMKHTHYNLSSHWVGRRLQNTTQKEGAVAGEEQAAVAVEGLTVEADSSDED